MAKRVAVAFVSDGIEGVYEKFGFVNCLAEAHLTVPVRNVERMTTQRTLTPGLSVRPFSLADLPAMVKLYNETHAQRPWTHERQADWNRLLVTETWQPGSEVIILIRDERIAGYAILKEPQFGHAAASLVVEELTANDVEAAEALLAELATRAWQMRFSEFLVHEPLDSIVGKAAQRLGCQYQQTFPPSGGMMGAILDRARLLSLLEGELRRRLPSDDLNTIHNTGFDGLMHGELVADNRVLLRLLIGHWSMADALAAGINVPAQYRRLFDAWFPGGGTNLLPQPYAHKLDRY